MEALDVVVALPLIDLLAVAVAVVVLEPVVVVLSSQQMAISAS